MKLIWESPLVIHFSPNLFLSVRQLVLINISRLILASCRFLTCPVQVQGKQYLRYYTPCATPSIIYIILLCQHITLHVDKGTTRSVIDLFFSLPLVETHDVLLGLRTGEVRTHGLTLKAPSTQFVIMFNSCNPMLFNCYFPFFTAQLPLVRPIKHQNSSQPYGLLKVSRHIY